MSLLVMHVRCRVCDFCKSVIRQGALEEDEDYAANTSESTIPRQKTLLNQDLCDPCFERAKSQLR